MARKKQSAPEKIVNLALQGGGAHGALAWGILDTLLEDGRIGFEGITATSAGTMNALALVQGLSESGRDGARQKLHDFWSAISQAGVVFSPVRGTPFDRMFGMGTGENPLAYFMFDTMTRMFSPYQFNPLDFNPLRDVLEETIDFDRIRACQAVKLFISATNVQSGKSRIFRTEEITLDVALASSCLPFLFKAVEINGEYFWDGGYTGNPALYPLFYETKSNDILLVHLNPLYRKDVPTTATEILNRLNEVTFNSSLLKELRAVAFVKKLIEHNMIRDEFKHMYKDLLVHPIQVQDVLEDEDYTLGSKFDTSWDFLTSLRDAGRKGAKDWLRKHYDRIGKESSVDLNAEFLSPKQETAHFFSSDRLKNPSDE